MKPAILISAMAITTMIIRMLPFIIFRKKTPKYISYLGKVLPSAIIGMLVIYCLKDVNLFGSSHGIPEFASALFVVLIQILKRNSLISILSGTVFYMLLIQFFFK
ncbi:MAG: AzlD domain-containing protein [Lachnospiraceae bacterium]|nr:AzlD domain-containing protein [Lachnospiraceae bacterium]